jgi:predicted transcriptional regulator
VTPNEIIANQRLILDSQERIEVYQRKVDELLSAQVAVIESQRRMQAVISENQRRLRENQEKLDTLLANQEIIQANQAKILANQAEIISLLCQ